MALEAGSVYAVLGGRFNPAGFTQFDATMNRSVAKTKAAESSMASSFARTGAASQAMASTVASAAAKMEAAQIAQQRAALRVQAATAAAAAATKKHGGESLVARQRTLQLAQAQANLTQANNNLANATAAHAAAQGRLTAKQSAGSKAAQALGLTSRNVATAGIAAVGVAIYGSLKASSNFQKQMAELGAVTGASGKQLKGMGDAAIELGARTGAGATQAAQAMTELAKGGLDAKTSTEALTGTIAMAQAGSLDLATAGETVANALNLFAMDGEQATAVADAFANAANSTTADIGFFAQGMAQGGAAAKAAGLDFQEATVFLEAMAANGFKSGSDAGTSMKTALIQLANPTKRAADEAARLGVTFFKTNGDMKSLPTISKQLGDAWGNLSRQERLASATRLAGTDGMRALFALVDQGPKKLRGFADANQVSGTAAEVARKKMESLTGQTQRLGAELEAVGIKLGNNLEPYLADAAGALADFFRQMREGEGFGGTVAKIGQSFLRLSQTVQAVLTGFGGKDPWVRMSEIWGQGFTNASLKVLGAIRAIVAAIQAAASIGGKFNPFRGLAGKAGEALKNIDGITGQLRALEKKQATVKLVADNKEALAGIRKVNSSKINKLVAKILGDNTDYNTKYKQLRNLKIPDKVAKILARSESAKAAIRDIKRELAQLQDRTINVRTVYSETGRLPKSGQRVGGEADGRKAGAAARALVGEGGGPEWIVDSATGEARRVDSPMVTDLSASEYVIPTEDKYRGRAIGLMQMLAEDMGLGSFARGRAAKSRPKKPKLSPEQKRAAALAKQLKAYTRHPIEWYDSQVSELQSKADNKDKKGKLTPGAQKARRDLKKIREQRTEARRYQAKIDAATTEADIQADIMARADTTDDPVLFRGAFAKRKERLATAISLLQQAVNKTSGPYQQSLRAQLERLSGDQASLEKAGDQVPMDAADAPTTYTAAELAQLESLDAAIAVAALTQGLNDDRAAIGAKDSFLTGLFNQVSATGGAGRGGAAAIRDVATDLRSTRDQLAGLTEQGPTADQQQLIDQANQRGLMAGRTSFIDQLTAATMAGANQTLVFQSYVPPSPTEAKRLADYTVGGIGYQRGRPGSTERLGV